MGKLWDEVMTVWRAEYARRRGLSRHTLPCPEAVRQMALEWLTNIDYGQAIHISSH